jgi:hypothetical protein
MYLLSVALLGLYCVDVLTFRKFSSRRPEREKKNCIVEMLRVDDVDMSGTCTVLRHL